MEWGLDSCVNAFEARRLREWIEEYLQAHESNNPGLLQRVRNYSIYWPAPVLVQIADFYRISGPGPEYEFPQDPTEWTAKVDSIANGRPRPEDLPPVIAWRDPDGSINLADGNHRVAALEQLGYKSAWALIHNEPLRSNEELQEKPISAVVSKHVEDDLTEISKRFRVFAGDCDGSSELYHFLSLKLAEDEDLLRIASMSREGQPEPNLFFGAIHLLLINGKAHALRRYFPSLVLNFEAPEDAYPSFRKFALDHSDEIVQLLQEKLVQTNEVQRSAHLFPAILTASRFFEDRPVALVELGASAGFNLLWDHYIYQYDEDEQSVLAAQVSP